MFAALSGFELSPLMMLRELVSAFVYFKFFCTSPKQISVAQFDKTNYKLNNLSA